MPGGGGEPVVFGHLVALVPGQKPSELGVESAGMSGQSSGVSGLWNSHGMGWTERVDGASEFLLRRRKRKLGMMIAVALLAFPNAGRDLVIW